MVEFAGLLLLQRMIDIKKESQVGRSDGIVSGSFKIQKLNAKVDGVALIVFPLAFIVFNVCYWIG